MTTDIRVRFWPPAAESATEFVCAYLEASDGPPHLHEEWQFGVPEFPSKLSLGAFQRYDVQAGDVTVVHPYDVHSEEGELGASPKWRMLYVTPAIVGRLCGGRAAQFPKPVVSDPVAAAELRGLLRQSADGSLRGPEFLRQVTQWLERFLARHAKVTGTPSRMAAVERARAYLEKRPTRTVTFVEIGAVAGVTISYLMRSFSREVGLPPQSYHAQVRLAHARRLLAEGRPATWVAYECKFADQSHLSRRFKECHGVTPGAFQAQYLGTARET